MSHFHRKFNGYSASSDGATLADACLAARIARPPSEPPSPHPRLSAQPNVSAASPHVAVAKGNGGGNAAGQQVDTEA
jgi:hypothetical protein